MMPTQSGRSTPPRLSSGTGGLVARKGKIATVLAQARASVQKAEGLLPHDDEDEEEEEEAKSGGAYRHVGTLDEPSRPVTPASMDSRINNIEARIFGRGSLPLRGGPIGSASFNSTVMEGYATKQKQSRSKDRQRTSELSSENIPNTSTSRSVDFSPSDTPGAATRSGRQDRPGASDSSVRASSELLRSEFADVASSIEKHLASAKKCLASPDVPYSEALLHAMEQLYDSTERLAKLIKKCPEIVFGDPSQCLRGLLAWLSEAHNNSSSNASADESSAIYREDLVDSIRHMYCRCILRLHLSIFSVTASAAVADTMVIILKEIYVYFKLRQKDSGESPMHLSVIELLLEVMKLTWSSGDKYLIEKGYSVAMEAIDARGSRQQRLLSSFELELGTDTVVTMIQCSELAASCVKMYTTNKQNRRKLLRLDAMNIFLSGLRKFIGLGTFWGSVDCTPPESVFSGLMGRLAAASVGPSAESILTSEKLRDQLCAQMQSVVEVLTIIRNLSLDEEGRSQIHATGTFSSICKLIQVCTSQPFNNLQKEEEILGSVSAVLLSAVRVTAKLSLYEDLREQLNKSKPPLDLAAIAGIIGRESKQCVRVMDGHKAVAWPSWHTWSLLSRAAFTLGNFTTSNDYARFFIGVQCSSMQDLMILLKSCVQSLEVLNSGAENSQDEIETGGITKAIVDGDDAYFADDPDVSRDGANNNDRATGEVELADATLKMTRLLANISIHQSAGTQLGSRQDVLEYLYDLVNVATAQPDYEELLLNAVATTTNIGFYACKEIETTPNPKLQAMLINITMQLANLLFHENTEIVGESLRALGNLSRVESVVQRLCAVRGDEAVIVLLSSGHRAKELAQAAAGVMVNMSGHGAFFDDRMANHFNPNTDAPEDERMCKLSINRITSLLRKSSIKEYTYMTLLLQIFYNCFNRLEKPVLTVSIASFKETVEDICELIPSAPSHSAEGVSALSSKSERQLHDFRTAAKLVLRALRDLPSQSQF